MNRQIIRGTLGAAVAALAVSLLAASPAAAVDDAAILAKRPPKQLSAFGFFADATAQIPAEGLLPFAPATPLFTDFAEKRRFVYVPEGKAAEYHAEESFRFPVGSALVKTFAYPDDSADGLHLVETRVLLHQESGWQAWAYVWNEDQSEAELNITGAKIAMNIPLPDGSMKPITYAVPNKNQCKGCHAIDGAITPIGPKARNLNHDFQYGVETENQLARWVEAGLLADAPQPAEAPSVPDWLDEAAPLEDRAKAWLDINCAHCHRREGPASNSGLFLTWGETDQTAYGIKKRPVAAGRGSGGLHFDIAPGEPDKSIVIYRVDSTEPGVMMPELGRSLTDPRAVELLRNWIASLR